VFTIAKIAILKLANTFFDKHRVSIWHNHINVIAEFEIIYTFEPTKVQLQFQALRCNVI